VLGTVVPGAWTFGSDPILNAGFRMETLQLDFQALRLLASPSPPVAAAQAAVDRAAAGDHITKAEAAPPAAPPSRPTAGMRHLPHRAAAGY
jgi:hypothetical protein